MRDDKGVELQWLKTLSDSIQEVIDIFGVIPDIIVDWWIKDMLEDKEWEEKRKSHSRFIILRQFNLHRKSLNANIA